jgi:hypothetical protein
LGANFYCDCSVSGGTGGDGRTSEDPFESVADILAYESETGFADGDDIYLLEGSTCTTTTTLNITWEGTGPENYSILGCYDGPEDFSCDGERPIIQRSGDNNRIYFYDDTQYFRVEYLHIKDTSGSWQNSGSNGISTKSDGGGGNGEEGYITITNCMFSHIGHYAIGLARMGTNVIITDNECDDQNGNCIYIIDETLTGATYGYIANNTCDELIGYNSTDGHCVGLQTTSYYIIENNTATDAYNGAFVLWTHTPYDASHNVFRNNKVNGSRQACVDIYHSNDSGNSNSYGNLAYQNICEDTANSTSVRSAIRINNMLSSNGNYVFNNTIYNAGYYGLQNRRAVNYSRWLNNIIVTDDNIENSYLFYSECNGSQGSNHTIDYNLWWSIGGDPSGYSFWKTPDDCTAMTWANWKADGWGGHDIVGNPDFVDTTNFELQSVSPAVDTGTWLTYVSSVIGTTVNVGNTYILHGNFGLVDEDGNSVSGMLVSFYDTTNGIQNREITSVTYGTSITIDSAINYIYNGSYPNDPDYTTQIVLRMSGDAPDIGAVEYQYADSGSGGIEGVNLY